MTSASPTGKQFELASGTLRASVTEVGATLRAMTTGEREVIDGFGVDEWAAAGRGQVLAPWPNRLDGGRYTFGGRDGQAPLDEPGSRNAIHGLVRWAPWTVAARSERAVTLGYTLYSQPAYPWTLELRVEYRLDREGLTVTTAATNRSDTVAPFGLGFHPYLVAGGDLVDDATLSIPARVRLTTDERGLPTGEVPVRGSEYDFMLPRRVGTVRLDIAYTRLARSDDGRAAVHLEARNGRQVTVWMDEAFAHVMVFTGDTVEPASRRRRGIAIEPMTCPPNAFATSTDVVHLAPGSPWRATWGIQV